MPGSSLCYEGFKIGIQSLGFIFNIQYFFNKYFFGFRLQCKMEMKWEMQWEISSEMETVLGCSLVDRTAPEHRDASHLTFLQF